MMLAHYLHLPQILIGSLVEHCINPLQLNGEKLLTLITAK